MPLDPKLRRQLAAQGHHLKPAVHLVAERLGASAVQQVRECLAAHPLIKVRIQADTGKECDAAAAELAAAVPCELVKRVGRVVLLYPAAPGAAAEGTSPDEPGS